MVLSASLALAQGIPAAEPEAVGLSSAKLKALKTVMQQQVDQGTISGVVMMIVRNGKLAFSEAIGYQDKEAGTALSKDAIFRIYSIIKTRLVIYEPSRRRHTFTETP